jgi:ribosome biogenesis GTPase / thiamine phosphate phosphatase
VHEAIESGVLDPDRYASFRKLERELRSIEIRSSARLRKEEKQRWIARDRESKAARRHKERF